MGSKQDALLQQRDLLALETNKNMWKETFVNPQDTNIHSPELDSNLGPKHLSLL